MKLKDYVKKYNGYDQYKITILEDPDTDCDPLEIDPKLVGHLDLDVEVINSVEYVIDPSSGKDGPTGVHIYVSNHTKEEINKILNYAHEHWSEIVKIVVDEVDNKLDYPVESLYDDEQGLDAFYVCLDNIPVGTITALSKDDSEDKNVDD